MDCLHSCELAYRRSIPHFLLHFIEEGVDPGDDPLVRNRFAANLIANDRVSVRDIQFRA